METPHLFIASVVVLAACFVHAAEEKPFPQPATAYDFKKLKMEKLGRGFVGVRRNSQFNFLSWRYKRQDPKDLAFNLYRDGVKINDEPIVDKTCWNDRIKPYTAHTYELRYVYNGKEIAPKHPITWAIPENPESWMCVSVPINAPEGGTMRDGKPYSYAGNDCAVGDVDGDGEYEILIKWEPNPHYDNSSGGTTAPVLYECVKLDGTSLWRISTGPNIRAGQHYNQFVFFDLDGDGCCELVVKTADGATDSKGNVIGDAKADWRNEWGYILDGPEYLSVFSGKDGHVIDTIAYIPPRGDVKAWGDGYGNRVDRFLATPAYLSGTHASAVMCRGYYTRSVLWAVDFNGRKLKTRWVFDSDDEGNEKFAGQGFHNVRVGDVDFDGKDEIIYGHMAVDDDGKGMYSTGHGHGDAMQLVQVSPKVRGLQVWSCIETPPGGLVLRSARTGKVFRFYEGQGDTGRCLAADIDPTHPGMEMWGAIDEGFFYANGKRRETPQGSSMQNSIFWMGDLRASLLPHHYIDNYNPEKDCYERYQIGGRNVTFTGAHTINGTKNNPAFQADFFGDWREEAALYSDDGKYLRIYMSTEETPYRFWSFMQDPVYRISVANQNAGYNACPQPGFYFGPDLLGHGITFRGCHIP